MISRKGFCFLMIFSLTVLGCSTDSASTETPPPIPDDGPVLEEDDDPVVDDSGQYIGLNFNEQLQFIDLEQIRDTRTTWVRGFVDFFEFYENPSELNTNEKITKYLTLKPNGYSTIFNIKWLFRGKQYPTVGSAEINEYLNFMDTLLDRIWDNTDIIVVGNEPIIETDQDKLNDSLYNFYVEVLKRVKAYGDANGEKPIYMGAFDNLYQDRRRDLTVVNAFFQFIEATPWIAGVDLHIHHTTTDEMISALEFASNKIRDDQKILVTEFSLMKHWRSNLNGFIPSSFASSYSYDTTLRNYQYIDLALKSPRTRGEWVDFLSNSDWFEERKSYLLDSYNDAFSKFEKFYVANYAFRQSYPFNQDFTANTDPWVLNGIYVNRSVETDPVTGAFQFNYSFIDDFRIVQDISKQ